MTRTFCWSMLAGMTLGVTIVSLTGAYMARHPDSDATGTIIWLYRLGNPWHTAVEPADRAEACCAPRLAGAVAKPAPGEEEAEIPPALVEPGRLELVAETIEIIEPPTIEPPVAVAQARDDLPAGPIENQAVAPDRRMPYADEPVQATTKTGLVEGLLGWLGWTSCPWGLSASEVTEQATEPISSGPPATMPEEGETVKEMRPEPYVHPPHCTREGGCPAHYRHVEVPTTTPVMPMAD